VTGAVQAWPVWRDVLLSARQRPGALAVLDAAGPVPYQALARDVDAFATELVERGLTRDDMVGLHLGFSYLHILAILALDRLGIASTSFPVAGATPAAPDVRPEHRLTALISGQPAPAAPPCRWVTLPDHQRPKLDGADTARLAALDDPPDALLRVIWSSGTTGGLKGTPLTRALLTRRLVLRRLLHGVGPRTRAFTGAPLSTPPGYMMVLATLAAGGAVILPSPSVDFVSFANLVGVTNTSGPPAMIAALLERQPRRLETVECFEVIGANLSGELARRASLALTPNLWIDYGTTETGRIAGGDVSLAIADPTAAGVVIPWIDVEIVDGADRPLPMGQEGRLRVRGPQVITGYYKDAAATRRNFRDGWFYPGDMGVLAADRVLRITGRVEDMIVRGSETLSPVPIEEVIRGLPGVRDAAVFAVPLGEAAPEIGAALVLEPGTDPPTLRAGMTAKLGESAPTRVFVMERLPRNDNGKVLRRELVGMALRSVKT
jgi:acyl-CoA synthetase (AMP-forming)/AMP-acid ligase II